MICVHLFSDGVKKASAWFRLEAFDEPTNVHRYEPWRKFPFPYYLRTDASPWFIVLNSNNALTRWIIILCVYLGLVFESTVLVPILVLWKNRTAISQTILCGHDTFDFGRWVYGSDNILHEPYNNYVILLVVTSRRVNNIIFAFGLLCK